MRYFIILFIFFCVLAKANVVKIENISTLNGLSQNDVLSINQDSAGFIWFGTNDGINQYDGVSFRAFRKGYDQLSSGLILGITPDLDHRLWVVTTDKGLSYLDLKTEKVHQISSQKIFEKGDVNAPISGMLTDKKGNVWVVNAAGIAKLSFKKGALQIDRVEVRQDLLIRNAKLFVDRQNTIWLTTFNSVFKLQDNKLVKFLSQDGAVLRNSFEYNKRVFTYGSHGLHSIKNNHGKALTKSLLKGIITHVLVDKAGSFWIANTESFSKYSYSNEGGLFLDKQFELEKKDVIPYSIRVSSMYQDATGNVFIGTLGNGVFKINAKGRKFRTHTLGLDKKGGKIRSILEDSNENLYIAKEGGGIDFLPKGASFKDIKAVSGFNGKSVFALEEISLRAKNQLLIGELGLRFLDPKIKHGLDFKNNRNRVFDIKQSSNGLIWIATYNGGLKRIDPSGTLETVSFHASKNGSSLCSNIIRSLCFDHQNRLWIGTSEGLNVLTPEEQRKEKPSFQRIKFSAQQKSSLSHNYVLNIFESSQKQIYVGTMGGGLNKLQTEDLNGSFSFTHFTEEQGLANNVVKAILEDDFKRLWISTNKGLSCFNIQTEEFTNYGLADGLQDLEFNENSACKRANGEFLFGGVRGINAFHPNTIVTDSTLAQPSFTGFMVLNRTIKVGDTINNRQILSQNIHYTNQLELKYEENSFAIQVASLHYKSSKDNKCKYKLSGFDDEWVEVKSGAWAKYTNLNAGNYVLKIKAANSDGVWSEQVKSIKIKVQPPFYLTPLMKGAYLVLLIITLLFFRKYTIIEANKKHELQQKELEKKKEDELSQMRLRFFTNISHEYRTPLTLIINPLERLIKEKNFSNEKELQSVLGVMYKNSKLLLRLTNQLLDFRKIELGKMKLHVTKGDLVLFLEDIYKAFKPMAFSKDIAFSFNHNLSDTQLYFDAEKIEKVVYNVLSNAFKFTEADGSVCINVEESNNDTVQIIISDTGLGIPQESQKNVFDRFFQVTRSNSAQMGTGIGLSYAKSLVDVMQGTLTFKSEEGKGTTFYIQVPKNKTAFKPESLYEGSFYSSIDKPYDVLSTPIENEVNEEGQADHSLYTLLIVEDNADLRNYLRDCLSAKYNILLAKNGQQGFDKCNEFFPDLVVSDVAMPEMDGIQLTKMLKEQPNTSHIPIVLLTAQSSDQLTQKGLNAGADVYLPKPFNVEVLGAHIQSVLLNRDKLRAKYKDKILVEPSEISPSDKDEKLIKELLKIVESELGNPELSVKMLAAEVGFSQAILNKKLIALTGQKAKIFIRSIRLKRAAQYLLLGEDTISEITYKVGFNDLQYFRKCFKAEFDCLPSEYADHQSND